MVRSAPVRWFRMAQPGLIVLVAMALLLAGCSGSQPAARAETKPAASAPVEIRLGTGSPPGDITGVAILPYLQQNVLKNYGKKYTIKETRLIGTNLQAQALMAGELDIVIVDWLTVAQGIEKGMLRDVALIDSVKVDGHPDYGVNTYLARDDGSVKTVADLKGKKVGTAAIGQSIDLAWRIAVKQAGLNPDRDVLVLELPFDAQGAALREKKVDTGIFLAAFREAELKKGGVKVLFTLRDSFGPNEQVMHMAKSQFLKEKGEAVKAWEADFAEARKWLLDPKNRGQAIKLMSDALKTPAVVYESFFGTHKDDYRHPDGCVSKKYLQTPIDLALAEGWLKTKVDGIKLIDPTFLPNAALCNSYQ